MRIFFIVALLIAGCGHLYLEEGIEHLNKKDYQSAYGNFVECYKESENPGCLHNAAISVALMGDKKAALELFTTAARYGEHNAIQQLENMGEPVPDADLLGRNKQGGIDVKKMDAEEKELFLRCKKFGYTPGTSEYDNCLTYMKNEGY